MKSTIISDNLSNSGANMLCTNCIYGDYWIDHHIFPQHQVSGFDCSYPSIGSKLDWKIDSKLVLDNENIARCCPKYQSI
jgi:hypothetical protein